MPISNTKQKRRRHLRGAKRLGLPDTLEPQLLKLADRAPAGDEWLNEIKHDGYRMLCRIDQGQVKFISRNQVDWTKQLSSIAEAVRSLPVQQAFLDGELVTVTPDGRSDFQRLQNVFRGGARHRLMYYVFDLMYLDGFDLRGVRIEQRKDFLESLVVSADSQLRYSEHIVGHGPEIFLEAERLGLEGIVCKRIGSLYGGVRSSDWLKVKCARIEEFVIGGYTTGEGPSSGFGALLVGYFDGDELMYAGRVGTGFTTKAMRELRITMDGLSQRESPFKEFSRTKAKNLGARWVRPQLVARVKFSHMTRDGKLRHPSFVGLIERNRLHQSR